MAKSRIIGLDKFAAEMNRKVQDADLGMAAANREAALVMQRHVVPKVPVRTGATRDAFADPAAVGLSREFKGGWRFGLITHALRKKGYKAKWIEFGTKGYSKGEKRSYPRLDKKGRPTIAKTKIGREIPARAAQPFFRPGIEAARQEIAAVYRAAIERALKKR
jgi:hypothetical protein